MTSRVFWKAIHPAAQIHSTYAFASEIIKMKRDMVISLYFMAGEARTP